MSRDESLPIDVARQIDRFCLQFEQAWQSDRRPLLEQLLEQWDGPAEYRPYYFEELLRVELEALERESIFPGAHQYVARFPDDHDVIRRVFSERVGNRTDPDLTATFVPEAAGIDDDLPTRIGRYHIQQELGRGAFGVVYLAQDPKLDCRVAIKQLNRERVRKALGGDGVDFSQVIENLMREARLAARLRQYQGIVAVLDVLTTSAGDSPADIYFVQEFIDGGPLKDLVEQGPVSPTEAARILQLVAGAMDHVHQHGIYHRDLKPGNIILDSRGNPCVVDFGLAIDAELQKELQGQVSGTLPYMAPEQMRGEAHLLDGRADIWALGVILYEMLTGRRPFEGKSRLELSEQICRREPVPLRAINPQLPLELERICLKCLSKRMADRYATAGALSEDLRKWLIEYEAGPGAVAAERPARLVPRGLRSFVEEDADFFPQLLPGPRDRHGLPESIRFWKQRIEEKDPERTFRVGLLYGPSGCGKSSLVRAGLLPRLNQVVTVYVESTDEDTEARLLGRLRKAAPQLSQDLSLPEAMMALREHPALSGFKKVLLVFDQFEQWLQSRSSFGREQLIEALRQCDGARVQALILVRDDFWMAVTRFLHELEVDLIPDENVAAVDLFPPDHAGRVLTEMGRAWGRVGESGQPSDEQEQFIRKVVTGLSRDGMVICVRLAVFAEMVKDKEWVPRTIDQVGGTEGVGERFLEEAFSSAAANPRHRAHEQAARQVLQALLPDVGTNIRGHMQSRAELLEASGYGDRPADFEELLRILDGELRLVTPTDPAGLEHANDGGSDATYYQLTHDYLVPSLRNWLTRRQRATRKGRAELLLAELADAWRLKPDARRLPSPAEWLSIVWWTKRSARTEMQQQMVTATTRRLARRTILGTLVLLLLAWLGYETNGRFQASSVVQSIASAEARELPLFMADLTHYRRWTEGLVERELAAARAEGELQREQRLELALAVLDPSQASAVFDGVESVPVQDLQVFADLLRPHAVELKGDLWRRFETAREQEDASALRPAALLATLAPRDERWDDQANFIAQQLVRVPTADAGAWRGLMEPVGATLAPELVDASAVRSGLKEPQQATLLDLIMDYAAGSPELLAKAVEYASPEKLADLLTVLERYTDGGDYVEERLGSLEGPLPTYVPDSLSDELREAIQAAGGLSSADGMFVQSLPQQEFDELNRNLQDAGYAVTSVRPWRNGDELLVAAVWEADSAEREILWGLKLEQIEAEDQETQEKGMFPVDFARYWNSDSTDPEEMQWVIIWAKQPGEPTETLFTPAVTVSEFGQQEGELPREFYSIRRFDIWMASDGEPRCSAIWTQGDEMDIEASADWRYTRAFGDLYPGNLQTDIRFEWIAPNLRDRVGLFKYLDYFKDKAENTLDEAERDYNRRAMSRYYSLMGDFEATRAILDDLGARQSKSPTFQRYSAFLFARCGDRERLLEHASAYAALPSARQDVIAYFDLCAAALSGETEECAAHLQTLEGRAQSSYGRGLLARAHAVLASVEEDPVSRTAHVEQSVSLIRDLVVNGQAGEPEVMIFDVDFDPIRDTAQFRSLFLELGFRQRLATSHALCRNQESRQLYGLPPAEHLRTAKALFRIGFQPHVVTVQADQADGGAQCASVWHRPVTDVDQRIKRAHREANLLLAAARFGNSNGLRAALSTLEQPDVRSYLILNAPDLLPLASIQGCLNVTTDDTEVQALLQILGAIPAARVDPAEYDTLVGRLRELLESRQTGVRSAARWCLRQWSAPETGPSRDAPQIEFTNPAGQRMLVVTPPDKVLMGSPGWEPGHAEQETRNWINIPRSYALTDTETTRGAFYLFLQDERVQKYYEGSTTRFRLNSASVTDDRPAIGLTWRDAALFCQWLSEMEELPTGQWCYPDIWNADSAGTDLPANYLQRTGYRLPTEAEWEWAARGGVQSASRFCGDDARVLEGYAWFVDNSRRTMKPVAQLRPNPFGFFDMLGNAREWCDDTHDGYRTPRDGSVRSDAEGNENLPKDNDDCTWRGGSSNQNHAEDLRSANRFFEKPGYRSPSTGFRVARTVQKQ